MEYFKWAVIIFTVIYIYIRFKPMKGINNITPEELPKKLKKRHKIQFIDVRTRGEFRTFHEKPFINIPMNKLRRRSAELDKQKEVVVICQTGIRSMQAAKTLKRKGFEHVTNVKGGLSAWK